MVLVLGARQAADLYMNELPQAWQAAHEHFSYVPVLSEPAARPLAGPHRPGAPGGAGRLCRFVRLEVYACGAPVMVEAAHSSFIGERQLPADAFYSDAFSCPGHEAGR